MLYDENIHNLKSKGEKMKRNVGKADRTIRVLLGIAIIGIGIYFKSWWGLLGIIPLFTATLGWCPAYLPFGISTCKIDSKG